MSGRLRLPTNTASHKNSIWRNTDLKTFREHIVNLQRVCDRKPGEPKVHSVKDWQNRYATDDRNKRTLPFDVEQRLADDLAFIAANENSVRAISAVALEERVDSYGLTVYLAANQVIPPGVPQGLETIFGLLTQCASKKIKREACASALFDHVMSLSQNRIRDRFEAAHIDRPLGIGGRTYRPLYQELRRLCSELKQAQSHGSERGDGVVQQLTDISDLLEQVNACCKNTVAELDLMKVIVRRCYDACTSGGKCTLEDTVSNNGFDTSITCQDVSVRQAHKIGRYWGLCRSMAEDAKRYGGLFQKIVLEPLAPYRSAHSVITFVRGARATLYAHAEIQILVHYCLRSNNKKLKPRAIGVSKGSCYLCDLFIRTYGDYFISKTHGELFDSWNLPNLADYDVSQLTKLRRVLATVDQQLQQATARERKYPKCRPQPMGSWLSLPVAHPQSPVPSTVQSSSSKASERGIDGHISGSSTPRAQHNLSPLRTITPTHDTGNLKANLGLPMLDIVPPLDPPTLPSISEDVIRDRTPSPLDPSGSQRVPLPMPPSAPTSITKAMNQHDSPQPHAHIESPRNSDIDPPTSTTTTMNQHDSPQPHAHIDSPRNSNIDPPTATKLPSLPSSSSIQSWEYPIQRAITANSPFRSNHGKLNLTIEIEGPFQGNVAITPSSANEKPAAGIPVNLRAMRENETLQFEKKDDDSHMVLHLNHAGDKSTQITLHWG